MSDKIDYIELLYYAKVDVLKKALSLISKKPPKNVHIIISFITYCDQVILPDNIRKDFPNIITIVLQHQFHDLKVYENHFTVFLSFKGVEYNISVPFLSIVRYVDANSSFTLDLPRSNTKKIKEHTVSDRDTKQEPEKKIISIDQFRKN